MSNFLNMLYNFTKFSGLFGFEYKMAFAKFKGIDLELTGKSPKIMRAWLILFNWTAGRPYRLHIAGSLHAKNNTVADFNVICQFTFHFTDFIFYDFFMAINIYVMKLQALIMHKLVLVKHNYHTLMLNV